MVSDVLDYVQCVGVVVVGVEDYVEYYYDCGDYE